jgi:hypothetical protein
LVQFSTKLFAVLPPSKVTITFDNSLRFFNLPSSKDGSNS